jgi:hypothetical protein
VSDGANGSGLLVYSATVKAPVPLASTLVLSLIALTVVILSPDEPLSELLVFAGALGGTGAGGGSVLFTTIGSDPDTDAWYVTPPELAPEYDATTL